jgi:protein gp37
MQKTAIGWTDFSANPLKYRRKSDGKVVWGCVKTSPGCAHCYSEVLALRWDRGRLFNAKNMEELEPFLDETELRKMLTYKPASGKRCFPFDMTDLFGEWVPFELIDRVFAALAFRRDVTFQILTKRAGRMEEYLRWDGHESAAEEERRACNCRQCSISRNMTQYLEEIGCDKQTQAWGPSLYLWKNWPIPNVWLGTSVENRKNLERLDHLKRTPAAVRFVSFEPLLEDLGDVSPWLYSDYDRYCLDDRFGIPQDADRAKVGWAVVGGESGGGFRPCQVEWISSLVEQCRAAGVPCFVKQDSGPRPGMQGRIPDDIWAVKEFPGKAGS